MIQPENLVKPTNRAVFNEGKLGPAGAVNFNPSESRSKVKQSTNQQFTIDTNRNANLESTAKDDNHNKDSFFVYPNEREITTERTYEGNINSVFKGETERLQDSVKPTIKETTLDDGRNGFVSTVTEVPTERLQDNVRPTVKDTTLFDYMGGAGGEYKGEMEKQNYINAETNPTNILLYSTGAVGEYWPTCPGRTGTDRARGIGGPISNGTLKDHRDGRRNDCR